MRKFKFHAKIPAHTITLQSGVVATVPEHYSDVVMEAPDAKAAFIAMDDDFYSFDFIEEVL